MKMSLRLEPDFIFKVRFKYKTCIYIMYVTITCIFESHILDYKYDTSILRLSNWLVKILFNFNIITIRRLLSVSYSNKQSWLTVDSIVGLSFTKIPS